MRTLASLTYKECPPIVTAESMRFLDGDTKRSRVSSSGFRPVWDLQSEPVASDSNEFASPIDAGYALMKLAGKACSVAFVKFLANMPKKKPLPYSSAAATTAATALRLQAT